MALFDPERKRIVIRVVYDGPGHAGKTTNLARLSKSFASWRRSELVSPNTLGERTQYFDWLEVDGGLLRSYPLRAQLLTVPGQVELTLRRQFVIERADVVVFVVDSQREAIPEARSFYAQLCEQLAGFSSPVPIVFQANKQDVAGALRPAKLAKLVCEGLRRPDQIKGTVAVGDRGVKQTLMVALRLASEGVRERWRDEDPTTKLGDIGDAEGTLAALEHSELQQAQGRPAVLRPTLPGDHLPSTQIWPPVAGRAVLANVQGQTLRPVSCAEHPERFAVDVGGWRLTTSTDRLYEDMAGATQALLQLSRRKIAVASWLPEPCAVAIVTDPAGHGVWLWTIDPCLPSLAAQLDLDATMDRSLRLDALNRFAEVLVGAVALAERHGLVVELAPENFAVQELERRWTRYVGHSLVRGDTLDLAGPTLTLAERFASDDVALTDFAEILCMGLHHVPADPGRRAALRQAFAEVELADPARQGPRQLRDAIRMVLARPALGNL